MNSIVINGRVLDFCYKRRHGPLYAFYVGDIFVGQIAKLKGGYTAIPGRPLMLTEIYCEYREKWGAFEWLASSDTPTRLGVVGGFKTRYAAAEFLLQAGGYRQEEPWGA